MCSSDLTWPSGQVQALASSLDRLLAATAPVPVPGQPNVNE